MGSFGEVEASKYRAEAEASNKLRLKSLLCWLTAVPSQARQKAVTCMLYLRRCSITGKSFDPVCNTGGVSVIFLSGPMGSGKTAVAKALVPLLPAPLAYIEGDRFWSFISKDGERELRDNFPLLVRSMTAAAVPFARSGFRVLIDFSTPPTFVDTARKILKEVPFDFVLLRPSLEVCAKRASTRQEGAISDYARLKTFYARFEEGGVEAICDDHAGPESLARRIAEGLDQGRFRVL